MKPTLRKVDLDDKYTLDSGRIFITGTQALVRLPLMQKRQDEAKGLNTGGFISGYRGSPLGGLDLALWRASHLLKTHNIHFQPGINEDLGATAVWGSQQIAISPGATVQGIFSMWYAKGPGVDRSGDAIKHANMAGTNPYGGVLALMGDDHACKSSTLPHQSDFAFMDAFIPVIYPSTVQDVLDLGLLGWAMSRYTGLWIGFKMLSDTVDTAASVMVDSSRSRIHLPKDF
jgi:indolepyruvate ferredoxin oxidoreductase